MTDPVEESLRRSLARQAAERDPVIDLGAVLARSARRRRTRRAAAGVALACAAGLGGTVVPSLLNPEPRPETLAENPVPSVAEDPKRLQRRVLAAVGNDGRLVGSPTSVGPGVIGLSEAGPLLAGRARRAGTAVVIDVPREGGATWTMSVGAQTLDRPPSEAEARALGSARASSPNARPIAEQLLPGGGRALAYGQPQGVLGVAVLPGGVLATADIATGARPVPTPEMASLALRVLRALEPDGSGSP